MNVTGLLILITAGLGVIAWWRLLKGKELARYAAAVICKQHGLVLMDDTVMLETVQLKREDPVRAWGGYPGGQNGDPASSRYTDGIDAWVEGRTRELLVFDGPDADHPRITARTVLEPPR